MTRDPHDFSEGRIQGYYRVNVIPKYHNFTNGYGHVRFRVGLNILFSDVYDDDAIQ